MPHGSRQAAAHAAGAEAEHAAATLVDERVDDRLGRHAQHLEPVRRHQLPDEELGGGAEQGLHPGGAAHARQGYAGNGTAQVLEARMREIEIRLIVAGPIEEEESL